VIKDMSTTAIPSRHGPLSPLLGHSRSYVKLPRNQTFWGSAVKIRTIQRLGVPKELSLGVGGCRGRLAKWRFMIDERALAERWEAMKAKGGLDERQRRLWAAAEARSHGRGGVAAVARVTRLAETTVRRGDR
jgi:hypothetical protein